MKKISKSDEQWRRLLTPEQFDVCRKKETEKPRSGDCSIPAADTLYLCSCCGSELFRSSSQFESGTGWPSFREPLSAESVRYSKDGFMGLSRTEVSCAHCDCHLGHVFEDGPEPAGKRYCINSVSIKPATEGAAGRDDPARWERMYQDEDVRTMSWYYPELDPDFVAVLSKLAVAGGKALDLCTGPGTQALALADRGLSVTATDISASAVEKAAALAREQGLEIDFRQNDILENSLEEQFDFIFDRGCFHIFPPEKRGRYVEMISSLVGSGGYLFLKCFSYREKRKEGPYRLHPDEIRERFEGPFEVVSIVESSFPGNDPKPQPLALFCVLRRR